jgi:hypothetical protein
MTQPTDFAAAVRALAAEERERAGAHPEAEEIAAYAAGTLDGARVDGVRAHLARCAECADLVLEYAEFAPAPAAGAAQRGEVAAAYDEMRRELGLPAAERDAHRDGGYARPFRPWLLAAATLAAAALGIWGWSQHRALEAARTTPRVNVAAVDLEPRGSDQVRGTPRRPPLDLAAGATLFLALPGMAESGELRVVIVDARDRALWSLRGARRDPVLSNLSLYLPPGSLASGRYEIQVFAAGGGPPLAVYPLDVR